MMKNLLFAVTMALAFVAPGYADSLLGNQEFVRIGQKTISSGDAMQKVYDAGGEPDKRIDLINKFGVKLGEEWHYDTGARSTTIIRIEGNYVVAVFTSLR